MVEAQAVPNLMDHGVGVPRDAVERWIQDDATCQGEVRALGEPGTLLPAAGVPRSLKGEWARPEVTTVSSTL